MKMKYAILIFCLALLITLVAAMFKIMHWPGADVMLTTGLFAQFIALAALVYIIIRAAKTKGVIKED